MSESLERRYRAALDWYPSQWREEHGDAALGTLLDEAEATGATRPKLSQTINLIVFGLRERALTALPASVRERLAAIALGTGTAFSIVAFVLSEVVPWQDVNFVLWVGHEARFGPFVSAAPVLFALWVVAFALAMCGLAHWGRWALAATLPISAALIAFNNEPWAVLRPPTFALATLALLAVLAFTTSGAIRPRGRARTVVTLIGAIAVNVPTLVDAFDWANSGAWWFPRDVWGTIIQPLAYAGILVTIAIVAAIFRQRSWAAATFAMALIWFSIAMAGPVIDGGWVIIAIVAAGAAVLWFALRRVGYRLVITKRN